MPPATRIGSALAAAIPVGLAAVVWAPILGGYFWSDDFACMLKMVNWEFPRFVLEPYGGHVLMTRNAVFQLLYSFAGLRPEPYFFLAFATHLLNVWLLFRLLDALETGWPIASFGAALWGTCPALDGALSWFSVYGQILLTTIVLATLLDVARSSVPSGRGATSWCLLLLIAATCFGSGVGMAIAFPVVALLLRPDLVRSRPATAVLALLPACVMLVYFGLRWVYAARWGSNFNDDVTVGLALRPGWPAVVLGWDLAAVGTTRLFGGFTFPRRVLPWPLPHRILVGFLVIVAVVLWRSPPGNRRRMLASIAFGIAAYGSIALGRAAFAPGPAKALEQSAQQVRFHYLATVPVTLLLCAMLVSMGARRFPRATTLLLLAWGAFTMRTWATSGWTIDRHDVSRLWVSSTMGEITRRAHGVAPGATVDVPNLPAPLLVTGPLTGAEMPGSVTVFAVSQASNELDGRRLRFVEPDPAVLAKYGGPGNLRLAALLVPPPPP